MFYILLLVVPQQLHTGIRVVYNKLKHFVQFADTVKLPLMAELLQGCRDMDLDVYKAYCGEEAIDWLRRTRMGFNLRS